MSPYLSWFLPPGASTFVGEIDWLYDTILVITGIAFVLVEATLIWFLIRYRARPGRRARYTHGNVRAEFTCTWNRPGPHEPLLPPRPRVAP